MSVTWPPAAEPCGDDPRLLSGDNPQPGVAIQIPPIGGRGVTQSRLPKGPSHASFPVSGDNPRRSGGHRGLPTPSVPGTLPTMLVHAVEPLGPSAPGGRGDVKSMPRAEGLSAPRYSVEEVRDADPPSVCPGDR